SNRSPGTTARPGCEILEISARSRSPSDPSPRSVPSDSAGITEYLLAGCGDGMIRIWQLLPEDLIAQAERTAGRNRSLAEWQQFFPEQADRRTFPRVPVPADATRPGR